MVEAKGLGKGYEGKLLIDGLDFALPPAGIVGIIGPNGAGKTTLFRMIMGDEKPDRGSLRLGETVQISYADQSRDVLDGEKRVWEVISDGHDIVTLGRREVPARAYASWFNFLGAEADQPHRIKYRKLTR